MGVLQTLLVVGAAWQISLALHTTMSPKERHHIFGHEDIEKVPKYWLDKPRKWVHPDDSSHFLYNISYHGREEVFRLRPHHRLYGDEFHMIRRDGNASAVEFSLADQHCTYQGESLSDPSIKIALVGCGERMHGMILSTEDATPFLIQPHSRGDEHVIHKRSLDVLEKHSCLFNPNDDPYPEDRPVSRRSALFPHERKTRLAIFNRRSTSSRRRSPVRIPQQHKEEDLTIELAVFADDAMWRHFVELYGGHADAEMHRFILAAVNNIDILYGQRVINPTVNIKIVRYEVIKTPPTSLMKEEHRYGDVDRLLDAFCDYQARLNPKGDEDPKHWDHALLFSGYDLYRDGLKTVAGYAPVKGMCSETRSCTINEGLDFGSVFVVTHEMGHSLGMYHDGDNECDLRCCIMSPSVGTGKTQWSSCSVKEFSVFVGKLGTPARAPNCLRDLPTPGLSDKAFFKDRESPGQQFTLGEQCAVFHGECWKHELRDGQRLDEVCEMVWCGNGEGIIRTAHPALEGTNCGPNLWCRNGQCVPATRSLSQIDGQWGTWNESPSSCRAKCSDCEIFGQMQLRRSTRLCNRPAANNGGRECQGDDARGIVCDSRPCGGPTIDEFATATCTKLKEDRDNPNPQLSGVGLQFEQAPCKIWCQLESSNNIRTVSNFPDGTPCGEGNFCIKGECRPLLCNGNAVAETENECPYGNRFRMPSPTPTTTTTTTTTTTPPPPPRTTRPTTRRPVQQTPPQARRMNNLQRFLSPQGNLPAARRLTMTTRPTPRPTTHSTGHRLFGSTTPSRSFWSTTPAPATTRPPMWSLWSEWSECLTVGCGERGIKVRIRRCVGDQNQYIRDDICRGHNRETAHCMGEACMTAATRRMPREMGEQGEETTTTVVPTVTSSTTVDSTTEETTVEETTMESSSSTLTTTVPPAPETPPPPPPLNDIYDDSIIIEVQDDVQEVSMTTTEAPPPPPPPTTTLNPRLVPLLPKGVKKASTTARPKLIIGDEEEYLESPSENEEFVRRASVKREERREVNEERTRKIIGDSPFSSDEVVDVPIPSSGRKGRGERREEQPLREVALGDGFQLQDEYIGGVEADDDDDVIDVPQPRSSRGGRRIKDWEDGRPSNSRPDLIDVPAAGQDYRVRNVPIRQFVPDPLNPNVMLSRNVAIRQLLPFSPTGSLETLPGPNPPLNPAQINPHHPQLDPTDPLNLKGGLENLVNFFKPLLPQVPTPSPLTASTLPQGLIPIEAPPPPPPRPSAAAARAALAAQQRAAAAAVAAQRNAAAQQQRAIVGQTLQPIRGSGGAAAAAAAAGAARLPPGRIRVYPGPPPSEAEVLKQFEALSKRESEIPPRSPFLEKTEDVESLPSPLVDDRLPLDELNDDSPLPSSSPLSSPSPSTTPSTTTTTERTTTEKRTLPPIFYAKDEEEEEVTQAETPKRNALTEVARVPKEIRGGIDGQQKDYIVIANTPSSLSALPSALSAIPARPRYVPLYGTPPPSYQTPPPSYQTPPPVYVQQPRAYPAAAASGPQYAQPTGVRTVYVVKGGTYGNVLANGSPSPSFTTAGYARPVTPAYSLPKYRTAGGYNTPAKAIIYGTNPHYTTTPYPNAPVYTTTPSYSNPPVYTTPRPIYSTTPQYTSPPLTYPTTPLYKPPPPEWGPWSPCSVTCGNGTRTRKIDNCGGDQNIVVSSTPSSTTTRVSIIEGIHSSTPTYVVEPFCVETEICELDPCFRYSEWSDWNGCSKDCGGGFSLRRRTCVLGNCPGPFSESKRCEGTNCEVPSVWGDWAEWSGCSATCGVGTKERVRVCQSRKCLGTNREARRCQNPTLCHDRPVIVDDDFIDKSPSVPVLDPVTAPPVPPITNYVENDWLSWNSCSVSCGLGTQIRRHRTTNRVQHRSCFLVSCNDFGV